MDRRLRKLRRSQNGFTLIEIIVVVAILGILAAILIPTVTGLLEEGDETALAADVVAMGLAVDEFKLDRHKGPDGTPEWGLAPGNGRRLFPTANGLVGNLELNPATTDPANAGAVIVATYVEGSSFFGGSAATASIDAALIWTGLLVNEPTAISTTENQTTGEAHPLSGEEGEYIPDFPRSAHPVNTTKLSGQHTDGTYRYVLLHNGKVVAVYSSGGIWYAGFNGVYP